MGLVSQVQLEELLQRVTAVLIQNQEAERFGQLVLSLRASYLSTTLVETFLYLSRVYLQPRCMVPLFAVCSNSFCPTDRLQLLDNQLLVEDRFIAAKFDRPHLRRLKVT